MLHIYQDIVILWSLLVPIASQRLMTQFGQYYAVSTDAFTDKVAHNCEHHVFNSNRTSECALFCSVLGRPRCFVFALGPGTCWVCGPDYDELDPVGAIIEAMAFMAYSGRCKMFLIFHTLIMVNEMIKIDGLVHDCSNSIANALELLQSCTKPSKLGFIDNWL